MEAIFNQVIILVGFALAGFFLSKINILEKSHMKTLSALLVNLFMPCLSIKTFTKQMRIENLSSNIKLLGFSFAFIIVGLIFAFIISHFMSKDNYTRKIYWYSLGFSNFGYFGASLISAVAPEILGSYMLLTVPFSLANTTIFYCWLTKKEFSFKRFLDVPIMALMVGIVLGLCNVRLPAVVNTFLETGSNCMGPISMIILGVTISEFELKNLFGDYRSYIAVALRLAIFPLTFWLLYQVVPMPATWFKIGFAFLMMPSGLNAVVYPKSVGESTREGAAMALISSVLCCVSIPLLWTLM